MGFFLFWLLPTVLVSAGLWFYLPHLYCVYGQRYKGQTPGEALLPRSKKIKVLCIFGGSAGVWYLLQEAEGVGPQLSASLLFIGIGLSVSVMDLTYRLIPDRLHGMALLVCSAELGYAYLSGETPNAWPTILVNLAGVAFVWVLGVLYERLRQKEALGLGDIKLLVWMAVAAGQWFFSAFLLASVAAVVWQFGRGVYRRTSMLDESFAMGPFLMGALVASRLCMSLDVSFMVSS